MIEGFDLLRGSFVSINNQFEIYYMHCYIENCFVINSFNFVEFSSKVPNAKT